MSGEPAREASAPGEKLLRIRVTLKGRPVRTCAFNKEEISVGRNPDADLFLDNPGISREHLKLKRQADGNYRVQDLGSANGTFLNEKPANNQILHNNDVLEIGKFGLWISYDEDRRGGGPMDKASSPSVEDGTMVLSAAELEKLMKNAHGGTGGETLKGPWPASLPNGTASGSPDIVSSNGAARAQFFVLGMLAGAALCYLVLTFFRG